MTILKRIGRPAALALGLAGAAGGVAAQDKEPIKFGLLQDFTAVYTFVTGEYNQGQQDYLTLVNEEGGIDGHMFEAIVRDTGNEPQRGIEAYNRAREEGAILFDFLSTPVSRGLVDQVMKDEVVLITPLHGRGDAAAGETFPFVFPVMATYWSQAAVLADHIKSTGGLEGKKVALVHIDSPFGREPMPVLEGIAEAENFEVRGFPYPSPGNEQSATWSEVRRYRPDVVFIWGAGGGQSVSVQQAIRNGIDPASIHSVVWMAETDARNVGADAMTGVKRFEAVATGTETPIVSRIVEKVVEPGKSAGDAANVGSSYYNIGVATMAVAVEAARLALESEGAPLDGPKLKAGFEMIENFDAEGMMPPITITPEDHQGGGYGRVAQWNGSAWEPVSDWTTAYPEIVQEEIEMNAAEYAGGN
ncbi:ABC transporter substrate-binding protein [Limimaricola pyoseonensis]|uniref:Amino acid/amide ABC transporter substrate-binding protein, HAAT family n=1 Tax=Limimaricola pyoseonensis TaxID=521013 RepID=A0A1G7DH71_9RHOB|nr:ABC transporter substrate-binding protein [Limimaricola pyoseonensis]SDE50165.1 amino acid/amide ABC transporter substrate-binding protein, HAAT family [Limimaricola pyoseonensis]